MAKKTKTEKAAKSAKTAHVAKATKATKAAKTTKPTKALYFECSSGISGDMTVAALLDLGASEEVVLRALSSLPVEGFEVNITRVKKSGLEVCDFDVVLDNPYENHDHDMAWLHGLEDGYGDRDRRNYRGQYQPYRFREHEYFKNRDFDDTFYHKKHHHDHHGGYEPHDHHSHRGLADIVAIIDAADMTMHAKELACRIFNILAQAEARVHATCVDEVHFHEVGAVDSIADIVAIAVALDDLNIHEVIVSELAEGRGTIRCQHGLIPIPAPAVANIVSEYGIALHILDIQGELVTPTGAATVAAVRTKDTLPERFSIKRIGMGAGKREYATPGILRAMIIEEIKE